MTSDQQWVACIGFDHADGKLAGGFRVSAKQTHWVLGIHNGFSQYVTFKLKKHNDYNDVPESQREKTYFFLCVCVFFFP